ncbi:MAG TPA: serine protease, partial [Agriterribacter sp.]|nr:serine protease [Agriterribacter sp.]
KGNDLHESLGEELLLITNAHVVSNDAMQKALHPDEAVVTFEVLDKGAAELRIAEVLWSSPGSLLDASVLRFDKESLAIVKALTKDIAFYPLAKRLPALQDDAPPGERVYIIGHPAGGTLQLSFQDNLLLDHEDPRIHYRTPTTGGSSGSPVFNQQWELIGLHHAGSGEMPRLHGQPGTYQANEGIWIQAIRNAIRV